MITGFNDQTKELTKIEKDKILPILIKGFKQLVGKDAAMTSVAIIAMIKQYHDLTLSPPRLRKMVNHIRINNKVPLLLSNRKGYYIASDQQEVIDYIKSLRERAEAIDHVADALTRQFKVHYT
tara:strand:+ start:7198 stop:7566 length:369 start_codon:yes stop_codon:yes gene_type:complete